MDLKKTTYVDSEEIRLAFRMALNIENYIKIILQTCQENLNMLYHSAFASSKCAKAASTAIGYKQAVGVRIFRLQSRRDQLLNFVTRLPIEQQETFWMFCNDDKSDKAMIIDIIDQLVVEIDWLDICEGNLLETVELEDVFGQMLKELELE